MFKTVLLQPTYIPSILNAAAMAQCKTLIFEVNDNFNKQSLRNRAYIQTANGALSLSIPIKHKKGKSHKKTAEARIENDFPWQRQHWMSIQMAYRSSPFFEFYEDDFVGFYEEPVNNLLLFNFNYSKLLLRLLHINVQVKETEVFEKKPLVTDLRELVSARKTYPINLPPYIQVFDNASIDPKTAVIDLLFSEGPNTVNYLRSIDLTPLL